MHGAFLSLAISNYWFKCHYWKKWTYNYSYFHRFTLLSDCCQHPWTCSLHSQSVCALYWEFCCSCSSTFLLPFLCVSTVKGVMLNDSESSHLFSITTGTMLSTLLDHVSLSNNPPSQVLLLCPSSSWESGGPIGEVVSQGQCTR